MAVVQILGAASPRETRLVRIAVDKIKSFILAANIGLIDLQERLMEGMKDESQVGRMNVALEGRAEFKGEPTHTL